MNLAYTIYTDNLPENVGGCANAFIVRIKPKYKNDVGIHKHEYTHVVQFWRASVISCLVIGIICYLFHLQFFYIIASFAIHSILYTIFRPYRMYAEAQAYANQAMPFHPEKASDDQLKLMAWRLSLPQYDLCITSDHALVIINQYR